MAPRILIVDDEPLVRAVIAGLLNLQGGYDTVEASDGRKAWLLIQEPESRVALVLRDVVTPKLTGTELASLIRGNRPEIPVLLMTAYAQTELLNRGIRAEYTFLTKPFSNDEVLTRSTRC